MSKLMRLWVDDYRFFEGSGYCRPALYAFRPLSRAGSLPPWLASLLVEPGRVWERACSRRRCIRQQKAYFSNPLEGNTSVPRQRRTDRWKDKLLGTCTIALPVPSSSASINVVYSRLIATTRPLTPGLSTVSTSSTTSPRRNGPTVKIRIAHNRLDNTDHMAKNATAATATNPDSAVQNTVADTPRRSSTKISALPMISQRKPPRSGINSCGGKG